MKRMQRGQPRSLHMVLLTAFTSGMGVLLLFVAVTLVPRVNQLLEQNAMERTRETVLQSASTLDVYVDGLISTLRFATAPIMGPPSEQDARRMERMTLMQQSGTDVVTLAFFGEDGHLRYGTSGALRVAAEEVRQSEWFQKALGWQGAATYFSPPHVQPLFEGRRALVLTVARALEYEEDGKRRMGVMLMDADYNAFADVISGITLGQSGYVYLMDEAGALIAHPRLQVIYQGLWAEDSAAAQAQIIGATRDVVDGRDRALVVATVAQTRWRMVGVAYIDELLALQTAFVRILTIVLACSGLLSLAAANLVAFYVTRPIAHLEYKMQKVQAGDLNVTISETGFREIRAVSSAFNHMLAQIRMLMERVVREQETKRLHELNALQAQINPHFLYNTLDSIVWMEERGRSREAITMVIALAKLFRISISKGRRFITVAEEFEHVRNYLIIQKMRFKDRFSFQLTEDPEAMNERTVKLIVQPLVENCINHAIDEAQSEELHIGIDVRVAGDDLLFTVSDDGVGIPEDRLSTLLTTANTKNGIGLKNVHERIQLSYGEGYGLTIHSVEDQGTVITIRIPRGWKEET